MELRQFVGPLVLSGVLALAPSFTSAALVDHGAVTTDTITGLDWLDLTATVSMSFDDVVALSLPGGLLSGWRHASRAEVVQFWQDAGGVGPFTGEAKGTTEWVRSLQELWGKTYPFQYSGPNGVIYQTSIAMTSDQSQTCSTCNLTVYFADNTNVVDSSYGDIAEAMQLNEAYTWQGQRPIGHALVRASQYTLSTVPEPSTLGLLCAGGLFLVPRRLFRRLV